MEECLKMTKFKHQNVMGLIGLCLDAGPAPYIVMPYMANGSLLQFLRKERNNILLPKDADEEQVILINIILYNNKINKNKINVIELFHFNIHYNYYYLIA